MYMYVQCSLLEEVCGLHWVKKELSGFGTWYRSIPGSTCRGRWSSRRCHGQSSLGQSCCLCQEVHHYQRGTPQGSNQDHEHQHHRRNR